MKTELIECPCCEGSGIEKYTQCCGVDMRDQDIDMCPDCGERWEKGRNCEECNGTGVIEEKP